MILAELWEHAAEPKSGKLADGSTHFLMRHAPDKYDALLRFSATPRHREFYTESVEIKFLDNVLHNFKRFVEFVQYLLLAYEK